jgi:hypothetical protein
MQAADFPSSRLVVPIHFDEVPPGCAVWGGPVVAFVHVIDHVKRGAVGNCAKRSGQVGEGCSTVKEARRSRNLPNGGFVAIAVNRVRPDRPEEQEPGLLRDVLLYFESSHPCGAAYLMPPRGLMPTRSGDIPAHYPTIR